MSTPKFLPFFFHFFLLFLDLSSLRSLLFVVKVKKGKGSEENNFFTAFPFLAFFF
jgi:hypothetical protein